MLPLLPPTVQSEVDLGASDIERTSVPAFINLYRHLTTQVLSPDGSTTARNQQYESSGVPQQLNASHVELASNVILLRALKEICNTDPTAEALSANQRELCCIVSSYLTSIQTGMLQLNGDIEDLMADELDQFNAYLPQISTALSAHLIELENTIAKVAQHATPPTPPSSTTHAISHIPTSRNTSHAHKQNRTTTVTLPSSTHIQSSITQQTDNLTTTIPGLLASLTSTLNALHATQTTLLTTQIQHLELHNHSTQTRHLTSHATFLATVSAGLALKTQIAALLREKETYAQQGVLEALDAKFADLRREENGLDERERRLRGLLAEFERAGAVDGGGAAGGTEVFERLGRGYGGVEREIEVLRGDVERLEREVEKKGRSLG